MPAASRSSYDGSAFTPTASDSGSRHQTCPSTCAGAGLPADIQQTARRKLRMLNAAAGLDDPRIPPANRLEAFKGECKGQYSIRINDPWRIRFQRKEGGASDVEIVDYH